jgi:hypothetical protein
MEPQQANIFAISIHKRLMYGGTQRYTYRYRKIKISFSDNKIVQNNEGGFTGKILRSKRSIMTQQTSLIIICINTVIQVNQ